MSDEVLVAHKDGVTLIQLPTEMAGKVRAIMGQAASIDATDALYKALDESGVPRYVVVNKDDIPAIRVRKERDHG